MLFADTENEIVERTTSTNDTDKFAKAVCAFANDLYNKKLPSYLMIDAFDDGSLNGLKVTDRLLRDLAGLRADGNIQPKPALMVGKVSFPDGDVAVVEVQPSKITPVKYKGVKDSVRIIRNRVVKFERLVRLQAERMERARINEEEIERLQKETESIR